MLLNLHLIDWLSFSLTQRGIDTCYCFIALYKKLYGRQLAKRSGHHARRRENYIHLSFNRANERGLGHAHAIVALRRPRTYTMSIRDAAGCILTRFRKSELSCAMGEINVWRLQ